VKNLLEFIRGKSLSLKIYFLFLYFLFPFYFQNKVASNRIENKQKELKKSFQDGKVTPGIGLPFEFLEKLFLKEIERKKIIEDKAKSMIGILSLSILAISIFIPLMPTIAKIFILKIFSIILMVYALLSILFSSVLLVELLAEKNIMWELSEEELINKDSTAMWYCIEQNREQNLLRTNYLYTIYRLTTNFMFVFLIIFILYLCSI
jgi:hypothetical protein